MLIGVLGGFGSGKTLLLAIWGFRLACKSDKFEVYSNFKINHKNVVSLTPRKLLGINPTDKKAVVLLDEVYAWLDSRVSSSAVNRLLSWIVLQSRKRNMDIIYSAQLGGSVDLRMRNMTDLVVYCKSNFNRNFELTGFSYVVEWSNGFNCKRFGFFLPTAKAKKWFSVYDTREIVKPIGLEGLTKRLEE
ncbi:MAG: hypothetical protein ACKD6O_08165 [Candidatus Bathyarchaeota archaeon]